MIRHLSLAGLFLCGGSLLAQATEPYSSSIEYKQMIEELRAPAPSPAFIATGRRPGADPSLHVRTREDDRVLRLTTESAEFTWDKKAQTLTISNEKTRTAWTVSRPDSAITNQPPTNRALAGGVSRSLKVAAGRNAWALATEGTAGCSKLTLELLDASLARLDCDAAAASPVLDTQIHIAGGGPFFGLGERFWQAGLWHTHLDVRPADKYGEPGHDWVYVAIPLIYSPGGLGLYADTAFDSDFRIDDTDSSVELKVKSNRVSFYLFTAADPKGVLTAYTYLTGRPQMPPLWSFGPWITALQGKDAVMETAGNIRAEHIPASALWVYDEMDEPNNLGWPLWFASYYGDPRAFTDALHSQGFKVLTYVHPYVRKDMLPYLSPSPAYEKGVAEGLLVMGADGLPSGPRFEPENTGNIDFTNPRAVDWWQKMLTSTVRDQGFDGWMEDFGEWVADIDHLAAGDGSRLSELYPLLYHKITLRIVQALNPSLAPFSRSGSPGSQQFSPVLWGADQMHNWSRDYGLPAAVTAGITAGMSGYSTWGPDILSDGDSRELWMRWVEFGALTPVMRDHPWSKPQYSINLWTDAETKAHFRKYAVLHSSLLPYFAAYADEAHRTGVPIIRHTMLQYPQDPRAYDAEYQYLLGDDLLVAPVVEPGATTRRLYLPQGEWVDYWTGERYVGGKDIVVAAPVDRIPLLVRAGTILPFKPEAATAALAWGDPQLLAGELIWKIYPASSNDAESSFALPDGTRAHLHQHGGTLEVEGAATSLHDYKIVTQSRTAPSTLTIDGNPLGQLTQPISSEAASGWWFDSASHELHVLLRAADFHLDVVGISE